MLCWPKANRIISIEKAGPNSYRRSCGGLEPLVLEFVWDLSSDFAQDGELVEPFVILLLFRPVQKHRRQPAKPFGLCAERL